MTNDMYGHSIVVVNGGVAETLHTPSGMESHVIDFDNLKESFGVEKIRDIANAFFALVPGFAADTGIALLELLEEGIADIEQRKAKPIPQRELEDLLRMEEDLDDTRSVVVGQRLPNGDLIVGVFPREGEYLRIMEGYRV